MLYYRRRTNRRLMKCCNTRGTHECVACWAGNTPKQTAHTWVNSCLLRHTYTSTHPQWLRSFIKSIFLHGNHLLAITSVGLMTLIRFNCIHLAVRGKSCTHSTPLHTGGNTPRWKGHKCLCEWVCICMGGGGEESSQCMHIFRMCLGLVNGCEWEEMREKCLWSGL